MLTTLIAITIVCALAYALSPRFRRLFRTAAVAVEQTAQAAQSPAAAFELALRDVAVLKADLFELRRDATAARGRESQWNGLVARALYLGQEDEARRCAARKRAARLESESLEADLEDHERAFEEMSRALVPLRRAVLAERRGVAREALAEHRASAREAIEGFQRTSDDRLRKAARREQEAIAREELRRDPEAWGEDEAREREIDEEVAAIRSGMNLRLLPAKRAS